MHIETAVRTDVGRVRDHNEDCPLFDEALGLFVVCDGMGGHAAGEVASELATRTVQQTVHHAVGNESATDELSPAESERVEGVLRSALENANAAVFDLGVKDQTKRGAGTTCTALLIRKSRGFLAHVGDSRAYLKRHGELHRLSTDHTLLDAAIRRGMPQKEAEEVFASNVLIRAIGPHENVVVDTLVFDVLPGDTYLLCSDGLHGYFEDGDDLSDHFDRPVDEMAEQLVAQANERGGDDNITVIAMRIEADEKASASEVERNCRVTEDLSALSRMQLFSEMAYPELLELAGILNSESREADQVVLVEGETSDSLYVIASGQVQVERADQVITTLVPGCHFGEMAVLTNRPRAATVRATEPTRLLTLSRTDIYVLFERRPAIGMKFLWKLAQVQSVRLDEAMVWRTLAEPQDGDQKDAAAPKQTAKKTGGLASPFEATLHGFPAPLSRRHK